MSAPQVARELSITRKSACAWRRAWEAERQDRTGLQGSRRECVPTVCRSAGAAGVGAGSRSGRARLD
ncbi:hypothetical protein ACFQX6_40290 [Streptosporangium lutulentum]